jgi:hypothetical protein
VIDFTLPGFSFLTMEDQPMSVVTNVPANRPSFALSRSIAQSIIGVVVAGAIGAVIAHVVPNAAPDAAVRSAGGLLQLLGVAIVIVGLYSKGRAHGLAGVWDTLRTEGGAIIESGETRIRRFVGIPKERPAITLSAELTMPGVEARARTRVRPGKNATADERFAFLLAALERVVDQLDRHEDLLEDGSKEIRSAVAGERQARDAAVAAIQDKIREGAIGGIRVEGIGIAWVLVGIILATWAPEITGMLPR